MSGTGIRVGVEAGWTDVKPLLRSRSRSLSRDPLTPVNIRGSSLLIPTISPVGPQVRRDRSLSP